MRRVAIVQARMGSTRLPGKVMADIEGAPMLQRVLERLQRCESLDDIVVATTELPEDDQLVALATGLDVCWFRFGGAPDEVLHRYVWAARSAVADIVVRVTGDCPLIDPEVVDRVAWAMMDDVDYVSNIMQRTYPKGLDVEAFHMDVLERVDRMAFSNEAHEHVTWLIREESPALFVRGHVVDRENNSDLNWSVDTAEDLERVRAIYRELGLAERPLSYRDVVTYARGLAAAA